MRSKKRPAANGKTAPLRAAAEDVLTWAGYMGGWDAPCWETLRQAVRGGDPKRLLLAAEDVLTWAGYMGGWDAPCWELLAAAVAVCRAEHASAPGVILAQRDTLCGCNHWWEEHAAGGGACNAPWCDCQGFEYDPAANTPEAIAERGGEHQPGCQCAWCRLPVAGAQASLGVSRSAAPELRLPQLAADSSLEPAGRLSRRA